jgi:hypothetical protein
MTEPKDKNWIVSIFSSIFAAGNSKTDNFLIRSIALALIIIAIGLTIALAKIDLTNIIEKFW